MGRFLNRFVQTYDFSRALSVAPAERVQRAIDAIREHHEREGLQEFFPAPLIPEHPTPGGELDALERELGVALPREYRDFLGRYRYLTIDDGLQIWGLDLNGMSYGRPWVSTDHRPDSRFLVFGCYWRYADGDQLMFDLEDPDQPVVAYLHEHGPSFEPFAPSFSLALWRLAFG